MDWSQFEAVDSPPDTPSADADWSNFEVVEPVSPQRELPEGVTPSTAGAGRSAIEDPRRLDNPENRSVLDDFVDKAKSVGNTAYSGVKVLAGAANPMVGSVLMSDPRNQAVRPDPYISVLDGPNVVGGVNPNNLAEAEKLSRRGYAEEAEQRQRIANSPSMKSPTPLTRVQQYAEENPVLAALKGDAGKTLVGAINMPSAVAGGVTDSANRMSRAMGGEDIFGRVPNMPLVEDLRGMTRDYTSSLQRKSPNQAWDDGEFGRWMMTQLAGNANSAAMSLGALFTPAAQSVILGSMGAVSAGNAYAEGDSGLASLLKGGVEVASEKLPLHAAEKLKDIVLAIPSGARNKVLAEAGKRLAAAGTAVTANSLVGAIEESAANIGGNAIDILVDKKTKSLFEDLDRDALVGAAFGGAMSAPALAGIASPESNRAREFARAMNEGTLPAAGVTVDEALRTSGTALAPEATSISAAQAAATRELEARALSQQATTAVEEIQAGAVADIGKATSVDEAIASAQNAVSLSGKEMVDEALQAAGVNPADLNAVATQTSADTVAQVQAQAAAEVAAETAAEQQKAAAAQPTTPAAASAIQTGETTEPVKTWFGRRGDGYTTTEDAARGLKERERLAPDLDWSIEPTPDGKYRLAGYARTAQATQPAAAPVSNPLANEILQAEQQLDAQVQRRPSGTLAITGTSAPAIRVQLAQAGIPSVPINGGIEVGRANAARAETLISQSSVVPATMPVPQTPVGRAPTPPAPPPVTPRQEAPRVPESAAQAPGPSPAAAGTTAPTVIARATEPATAAGVPAARGGAGQAPAITGLTSQPSGTLLVTGDAKAIAGQLRQGGITKFTPTKGGILVGVTQASKAREVLAAPAVAQKQAQAKVAQSTPAQLLNEARNPTSPAQDAAAAELRRRETDAAYRQREEQRTADEERILEEARDQQAAQATKQSEAQELDAPSAMQVAMEKARARREGRDVMFSLSQRFSEDNRLSNLSPNGASWQRIRENNPALRGLNPNDEVTVYRATIGDAIRPDDFVAVDKSTLRKELANVRARDGQAAKIVEQKVKVRDLLMGNDATEFVYFPEESAQVSQGKVDEATGLPLNEDGTVTVYHHTSAEKADEIRRTGRLKAAAEPDVYVTTRKETDTGYGDTAVPIRVKPEALQIDDEFPDGRTDYRLNVGRPGGSIAVKFAIDGPRSEVQNQADEPSRRTPETGNRTVVSRSPGTSEQQRIADDIAQRVSARLGRTLVLDVVAPGRGESSARNKEESATVLTAKRLFGQNVIFVRQSERVFHGLMSDAYPNTVFIDIDTDKPMMAILGHELLHQLRKNQPGIYRQLDDRLTALLKNPGEFLDRIEAQYRAKGMEVPQNWDEELFADVVGDNFTDPEFWTAMAESQPRLFQRVAQAIRQFLNNVLLKAKPFGTDQFMSDVRAARNAVADAMRQFSGAEVGAMTDQMDGVALSVADSIQTPAVESPAFERWFDDSKVVDAEGKPLVVYHGTVADFDSFDNAKTGGNDRGLWGRGHYFSAVVDNANSYALRQGDGARVIPAYVSIKNPLILKTGKDLVTRLPDGRNTRDLVGPNLDGAKIKEVAISGGHDGVIQIRPNGLIGDLVAYSPEQIKSAIGNNGRYDPNNPDINFSLTSPQSAWEVPPDTRTDKVIFELSDMRVDLKRVQQAIAKAGRDITEGFDARLAETLFPGRVARETENFLDVEVKPVLEFMAKNGVTQAELSDYMLAHHAPERNAQIARVNDDMQDGGAGTNSQGVLMTTQAAKDHIAALPAPKRTILEMAAKRVDDITKGTRDLLVSSGLESQSTVDAWTSVYKNYVPLFKDEAMETPAHPIGSGMSVTGKTTKRATGSTGEVTNMLAHVLMQRESAITRAEKNKVAMSLYGLALTNPNAEMWTTIRPSMPTDQIEQELQRMGVDPVEAQAGMQGIPTIRGVDPQSGKVIDRPNPMYKRLDNAIVVKVGGEDRVILFNASNPRAVRLAKNLKGTDSRLGDIDLAGSIVGKATRYFASINTQYNPAFGMVNIVRDIGGALVNLTNTALAGKQAKILGDIPAAMVGVARDLRGDPQRTPWSDLWKQFQDDGGRTGYRDLFVDPYKRAEAVQSELDKLSKEGKLSPAKAAHAVLDFLDDFNTTLENGVRLSAYKAALDDGMSRAQAARLARELTLDFNRKGRTGRELGPLYAFFNASIQGTARTLQAIKGPAGKKIVAGGLALGVIQALMLAAAGFEDDEIPEFIKARAFIIPLPGKQYIAIPLQFGLNALPNTGRVITELLMNGGKDWAEKSFNAIGELAGSFNPLGGGNIFTAHGALATVAPTILDPVVDMATNNNFAGTPISKERMPWDTRPGFTLGRESTQRAPTGQAYIGISKAINSISGGNDFKKGLASPTPEDVKYVFNTVGGGVYRELEKAFNASALMAQGQTLKAREVPLGGRFAGEVEDQDLQRSRFFKNTKKIEGLEAEYKGFAKSGRKDEAAALMKKEPLTKLYEMNDDIRRSISELNKLAATKIDDKEALKKIDAQRNKLYTILNERVRKMEKAQP